RAGDTVFGNTSPLSFGSGSGTLVPAATELFTSSNANHQQHTQFGGISLDSDDEGEFENNASYRFGSAFKTASNLQKMKNEQLDDALISGFAGIQTNAKRRGAGFISSDDAAGGNRTGMFGGRKPPVALIGQKSHSLRLDPPRFFAPTESTGLEELFEKQFALSEKPEATRSGLFSFFF
ncbi:hypothetical protein HDU98_008855, partial [Podochytrium sp. JEL0797]